MRKCVRTGAHEPDRGRRRRQSRLEPGELTGAGFGHPRQLEVAAQRLRHRVAGFAQAEGGACVGKVCCDVYLSYYGPHGRLSGS